MKAAFRNLYLGAACAAALVPQMASAQTAVTLYGRVVSGLAYIDNVYDPVANASFSKTMVAGNQWGTSMWFATLVSFFAVLVLSAARRGDIALFFLAAHGGLLVARALLVD